MKTRIVFVIELFLFFISCNSNKEHTTPVSFGPKVVEARGYVVPEDSMAEPKVVPAGKSCVSRLAGKPKVVYINTNTHPAGIPKVVIAGVPRVCTPGKDSFTLPKTVFAVDRPFKAGIPEIVMTKDAISKEHNPQNFSSYGKLQGLKSGQINCLLEDIAGNLWFGSGYGGVVKYDGKNFTYYTTKEGLSDNFIWSILEDKKGNLWFGTLNGGVCKYDGKNFTHFTEKEGLSNNAVWSILEDRHGNLWFGTAGGGVNKYDGKNFTLYTTKEGLSQNGIWDIHEDKKGNLWFATADGGVCKYDGVSFTHFTKKEGLSDNYVWKIREDKSGNLWFAMDGGGVSKYDGKSFTNFSLKDGLSSNAISCILEDKNGNLWLGTHTHGVSKYDGKNFTLFTENEGLTTNNVSSILEDKSNNLWFGTIPNGVSKYDGKLFTHFTEKEGLSDNMVRSILKDKNGHMWFGTNRGGVNKYDGNGFSHLGYKEGLQSAIVCMLEDKKGNIWFGNWNGVFKYDGKRVNRFTDKDGLSDIEVKSILEDKSGNLWFGTLRGGVSKYDGKNFTNYTTKEGLSNNFVLSILEDKNGDLWFGTQGGGVNKYDGKGFTHFTEKEGLSNNSVWSMLEDKNGNLWFGTDGGGVTKYDGKWFTHFTEKDGLSNNTVWSMLEDKNGDLWFGTRNGINKLDNGKLSSYASLTRGAEEKPTFDLNDFKPFFKTFTYEDGLSGYGLNFGKSMCEANDGTIWIGTTDRLTAFHPDQVSPDTIPPNIQLTNLTLFNENIPWQNLESGSEKDTTILLDNGVSVHGFQFDSVSRWYGTPEHLSLAYNNNSLTFQYVGITINSPKKVKYKYKLEGLDDHWSALTNRNEANYNNLPPDTYTFKVKAMNGDGYWSKELNYAFSIRPPWWGTFGFRFLSGLMIISLISLCIYLWLRYTFRQKLKVELIRQKIAADLHDEIGSNLSSMAFSLDLVKKKLDGSRLDIDPILNRLVSNSQEASTLISDTIWSLNPKNDSFDKLKEHMNVFAQDMLTAKEIDYEFNSNGYDPSLHLSLEQNRNIYLVYKEAINNIAKHSKASQVKINIETLKDKLIIEIKDNGIGFNTSESYQGNGLNNFKSRSIKDSSEVEYSSVIGKGTVIKITANYNTNPKAITSK